VHYPLPLKFDADPDPAVLRKTIARLRSDPEQSRALTVQLQQTAPGGESVAKVKAEQFRLVQENKQLKAMLDLAQQRQDSKSGRGSAFGSGAESLEAMEEEITSLKAELLKKEREIRSMANQTKQMSVTDAERFQELEKRVWQLEDALADEQALTKRLAAQHRRAIAALEDELAQARAAERTYRSRLEKSSAQGPHASHSTPRPGSARSRSAAGRPSGGGSRSGSRAPSPSSAAFARPTSASIAKTVPSPRNNFGHPFVPAGGGSSRPSPSSAAAAAAAYGSTFGRVGSRPSSRGGSRSHSRASSRDASPAHRNGAAPQRSSSQTRFDPVAWVNAKADRAAGSTAARQDSLRQTLRGGSTPSPRTRGRPVAATKSYLRARDSPKGLNDASGKPAVQSSSVESFQHEDSDGYRSGHDKHRSTNDAREDVETKHGAPSTKHASSTGYVVH